MEFGKDEKKDLRREQIVLLVKTFYNKFEFLRYESLDLLIDKALSLFLDSDLTIEEISDKLLEAVLERKKDLDNRYDNEKLKDNHEDLYGKLERLFYALNKEGIDCQLAGNMCGYIKYGEETSDLSNHIEVYVNEDDIPKFRKVCIGLGLMFEDNRLDSPRTLNDDGLSDGYEVNAKSSNDDFNIGELCFERGNDGSIINKQYYKDENGNSYIREEVMSSEIANEVFSGEEVEFRGTPIAITLPEYIYLLNEASEHKKDRKYIEAFSEKIDKNKLGLIRSLERNEIKVRNVPVSNIFDSQPSNPYNDDSDDDLGMMLADDESSKDEASELNMERGKVLIKTNNNIVNNDNSHVDNSSSDEGGYASSIVLSTISIMALIGIITYFMVLYLIRG